MTRIAIIDDYQRAALTHADWTDLDVTVFPDRAVDEDALVDRLAPFEIVVCVRERTRFPASVLTRVPALRLLVSTGMGTAHIDLAAARAQGIVVSGTPGVAWPPAELTWAMILALARNVVDEQAELRAGGWGRQVGFDLHGATLGVIGLGRQGSQVARIGGAFGMTVLAWSENLSSERAANVGVELARSKHDLMSRSDVVSIHVRLSERTRRLVGRDELASMKPTAYLINTSRGPIVDETALVAALKDGVIAGAGLDVFDAEPLPAGHPLLTTPNTLLTPHIGYVSAAGYRAFYGGAVEAIRAYLDGQPIRLLS